MIYFCQPPPLLQCILAADLPASTVLIDQFSGGEDETKRLMDAKLDGNRNVLHACLAVMVPPSNKLNSGNFVYFLFFFALFKFEILYLSRSANKSCSWYVSVVSRQS